MRLLSRLLWLVAFVVATFCFMVLFTHGFSAEGFTKGLKQELGELAAWFGGEKKK
jgi:hypothetical protein